MAFSITSNTQRAAARTVKEPNLVLCIDGLDDCLGSGTIKQLIKIGQPDLFIDGSWTIGGSSILGDASTTLISLGGSSTSIKQQLDADKGRGSSIQSIDIELVDINGKATEIVSPGVILDDVLGRKAKVYLALDKNSASWPDDYLLLFRGIIDDVKAFPASVVLTISHPEQKKKAAIYPQAITQLDGAINSSVTTIDVVDTAAFILPVVGPDLTIDSSFQSYFRIDDEVIRFTGYTATQFTGCTRGALGTFNFAHDDEAEVTSFYRLQGTAMDLALKVMMSKEGPFAEAVTIQSIQVLPDASIIANALVFDMDIAQEWGVVVGDFITTTLATIPANNFSGRLVTSVVKFTGGSYITVDGAALVDESPSTAVLEIRSKYDTLPMALSLGGDEVDVAQHEYIRRQFLSSFNYDIYLKESVDDARDFLDQEIYKPASAYSLPRKTRASVQLLIGPIPGAQISTLSKANIINPSSIRLRRSINKNFFNTIVYRFDEDPLEDKFKRGRIEQSATSLVRIPVGTKALVVTSKGMRETLNGQNLALQASERRINRFKFGAEFIEGLKITLGIGFNIEVGDIVILDPADLNIINSSGGNRVKPTALFEVQNKTLNYKTGEVTVDILDTAFDGSARYCLVGPSSYISSAASTTQFTIQTSFLGTYGVAEFQKWASFPDCAVAVRSPDSVIRYGLSTIASATSNTITLATALSFTPLAGDIMELAPYDSPGVTDQIKLIYGHQAPLMGGADPAYQML